MKNLMRFSVVCLFLTFCTTASGCNGKNTVVEQPVSYEMASSEILPKRQQPQKVSPSDINVKEELLKAKTSGKAVFLVITESDGAETENALTVAKYAMVLHENAEVIQLNRDDASNSELVKQWRLETAPLPLILVLSTSGTAVAGYPLERATPELLASSVPSPNLEDVYEAIGDQKTALVVFTKPTLKDREEVLQACSEAVKGLNNKAVIIEVNMDDKREENFLKQMRIKKSSNTSTTLVINTKGQVAGTSQTIPDASKLVAAATQPVRAGCGPGCGPKGCEK